MKTEEHNGETYLIYDCPGCKHTHSVPAERWHWNGSLEKPTLSPSVRHFWPAGEHGPEKTLCHYHIENGIIKFCGDCEHELKGQSVPL